MKKFFCFIFLLSVFIFLNYSFAQTISKRYYNNPNVYINFTQDGGVLKYDMSSNTSYVIVGCGTESTIVLDARGDSTFPAALYWEVVISLPTLQNAGYVDIYSNPGSYGLLVLNVPSDSFYDMIAYQADSTYVFGRIMIGGLLIRVYTVDYIQFFGSNTVNLLLEGTPSAADLYIDFSPTSQVTFSSMNGNVVTVGPSLIIPNSVAQAPFSIINVGKGTNQNSISCTFASQVNYVSGCVTTVPAITHSSFSPWLSGMLASLSVDPSNVACNLYSINSQSISIDASSVYVKGLNANQTAFALSSTGNVLLDDTVTPWGNVVVQNSNLTVDNRFQISLSNPQASVTILPPTFTSQSMIQINCAQKMSTPVVTNWNFSSSSYSSVPYLSWQGGSCNGIFFLNQPSIAPDVSFSGIGTINLNLVLSQTTTLDSENPIERTISLDGNSFNATRSLNQTSLVVTWDSFINMPLVLTIEDGTNDVFLDTTFTNDIPQITFANGAVGTITSPVSSTILVQNQILSFNAKNQFIQLQPSQGTNQCLDPATQCVPQIWADLRAHNADAPCFANDTCVSQSNVILNTAHRITCMAGSDTWTLTINPDSTSINTATYSGWSVAFAFFYFLIAVIGIVAWTLKKIFFDAGWTVCVLTACLIKLNDIIGIWDLTTRFFIQAAQEYLINFFTGLYCYYNSQVESESSTTQQSVNALYDFLIVFSIIILVNWLLYTQLFPSLKESDIKQKAKVILEVTRRFFSACVVFFWFPFVVSHVINFDSLATTAVIILTILVILVFCFYDGAFLPPKETVFQLNFVYSDLPKRDYVNMITTFASIFIAFCPSLIVRGDITVTSTVYVWMIFLFLVAHLALEIAKILYFIHYLPIRIVACVLRGLSFIFGVAFIFSVNTHPENPIVGVWFFWMLFSLLSVSLFILSHFYTFREKTPESDLKPPKNNDKEIELENRGPEVQVFVENKTLIENNTIVQKKEEEEEEEEEEESD